MKDFLFYLIVICFEEIFNFLNLEKQIIKAAFLQIFQIAIDIL